MCIFYVSSEQEELDESLSRPTAPAEWWPENTNIYAPRDLLKKEKGTWIGVSRTGRVAVLVNKFEAAGPNTTAQISRGALPKQFLCSDMSPSEWVESMQSTCKNELNACGGFSMLVAALDPATGKVNTRFLSNYDTKVESLGSRISIALSNGEYSDQTWHKITNTESMFRQLDVAHIKSSEHLTDQGLSILQSKQARPPTSRVDLRNHIFIPPIKLHGEELYGTRTQTAILIDKNRRVTYTELDAQTGEKKVERFDVL